MRGMAYTRTAAEAAAPLYQDRKLPSREKSVWTTLVSPATHLPDDVVPACCARPEDWFPESSAELTGAGAVAAVTACGVCPLRQGCARVALDDAKRVCGIWAGVYIPIPSSATQSGPRRSGLRTLRALAGYTR